MSDNIDITVIEQPIAVTQAITETPVNIAIAVTDAPLDVNIAVDENTLSVAVAVTESPVAVNVSTVQGIGEAPIDGETYGRKDGDWTSVTVTETDPIFTASEAALFATGDKAKLDGIEAGAQVNDPETDPIFAASAAANILLSDITNWNSKLSAETDPIFLASVAAGITLGDITNWNAKQDALGFTPVDSASVDWLALTGGGETALHSHAGGGGGVWGSITGILSNQTDLQAALDDKLSVGLAALLGTANIFTATQTMQNGLTITNGGLIVQGETTAEAIKTTVALDLDFVEPPNNSALTLALVADGGAGNVNAGVHRYYVAYVTALGVTDISGAAFSQGTAITTDATHKQVTVTVPISADPRVTGRRIYRTKAGEVYSNPYLLATINDNTTATYNDNIADASLTGATLYLQANTTNKFITVETLPAMLIDRNLVTLGQSAGASIAGGGRDIFLGFQAGYGVTTGIDSTAIGYQSLYTGLGALGVVAIGSYAGYSGGASANFQHNIFIGHEAGRNFTQGKSLALGYQALYSATPFNAYNQIGIGYQAGFSNTSANNCIYLGLYAGYRQTTAANVLIIDSNTAARASIAAEQNNAFLYGSMAANGYLALNIGTTTNNAVREAYRAQAYVSTASAGSANGFGVGYSFYAETGTDATYQQQGLISTSWIDATNASRKAKMSLSAYDTAARLGIEIQASGTEAMLGFYGVTPIARAVLATGTSKTVDDVITALQNLGLVKQS